MNIDHYQHGQTFVHTRSGVRGFLAWLILWFRAWTGEVPRVRRAWTQYDKTYAPNRYWRRLGRHPITAANSNRPYVLFCRKGLSPTQFAERLCALSGRGRVRVYRMPYWRKTVKGKACPLGTGHEHWRDPLGLRGQVDAGLCDAHFPP